MPPKRVSAFAVNKSRSQDSKEAPQKVETTGNKDGAKKRKKRNKAKRKKSTDLVEAGVNDVVAGDNTCIEISDDECITITDDVQPDEIRDVTDNGTRASNKSPDSCRSSSRDRQRKLSKSSQDLDDSLESKNSTARDARQRKRANSGQDLASGVSKKSKTIDSSNNDSGPDKQGTATDLQGALDETYDLEDTRNKLTAIQTSDGVILVAQHPVEFILKGRVKLQMLAGSCSVMGYALVPGRELHDVFSPTCNSLVTVKTTQGTSTKATKTVKTIDSLVGGSISDGGVMKMLLEALSAYKPCVVMRLQKLESKLCSFICKFSPYTGMFKIEGDRTELNRQLLPLDVIIPRDNDTVEKIVISDELQGLLDMWNETLTQKHTESPVMLVCGGKDSGKSTTNRMFLNSALNQYDKVYYLECDIGQTEFTPPGLVSLIEVTSPLFGPPFTHQKSPVCCYHYGGVTVTDDPDLYIHCVSLCVQYYRSLQTSVPLVINCMGWMKGLGWQLLLDIVRITSPSHLVQLKARLPSQNVQPVTVDKLTNTSFTDLSQMYNGPPVPSQPAQIPTIVNVETPFANSHQFKRNPQDHRNLSILSHLGDDLDPGLTLTSMTPYVVSWTDVAVRVCHVRVSHNQVMYALNASLVALCEADISKAERISDNGPLYLNSVGPHQCIGYGIIRGVDMANKKFYVVTSLDEKQLSSVTLLEKCAIPVPENFLTTQKCEKMLYVDEVVSSIGISAVRPRKHLPRKGHSGSKA